MHYLGSKRALIPFLQHTIFDTIGRKTGFVFADLFSGTGSVARAFKSVARHVIANDIEAYSFVRLRHYIGNHRVLPCQAHLDYLNALPGTTGFIANHYGEGGSEGRLYFSQANSQKLDAIRQRLGHWRQRGELDDDQYYTLLTSLLEAADRVANTTGLYAAFLKHLKPAALVPLLLRPPPLEETVSQHTVYNKDANALISQLAGDVLYLDPPYNERQYGANYHLLNTITHYDAFTPQGKTGLRRYTRSRYCSRATAATVLEELIRRADFEYIFLSYSDDGLLTPSEIGELCSAHGAYSWTSTSHRRYRPNKAVSSAPITEYLHVLHKSGPAAQTQCLGLGIHHRIQSVQGSGSQAPVDSTAPPLAVSGRDALPRGTG